MSMTDVSQLSSESNSKSSITNKDLIEFFITELDRVNEAIKINNDKIDKLSSLFGVSKNGTILSNSYQVTFNQGTYISDKMADILLSEFHNEYGLNLADIKTAVESLKETLLHMKSSKAKKYCEVDLFSPKKEPIEC